MPSALIILANGFEEIEAVAVIDILRRAEVQVTVAGLDSLVIPSARQLRVQCDALLADVADKPFDVVILPGGEPGTTNLEQSALVRHVVAAHAAQNKLTAAICAAPRILDAMGLLTGKKATSFPLSRPKMKHALYSEERVVEDGHFMTSRGPGTAMEFGYALVAKLKSKELAESLRGSMVSR